MSVASFSTASQRTSTSWSNEEACALMERWQERLGDLRLQKRNSDAYNEIAASLRLEGYEWVPSEIKVKIKNLTQQHR